MRISLLSESSSLMDALTRTCLHLMFWLCLVVDVLTQACLCVVDVWLGLVFPTWTHLCLVDVWLRLVFVSWVFWLGLALSGRCSDSDLSLSGRCSDSDSSLSGDVWLGLVFAGRCSDLDSSVWLMSDLSLSEGCSDSDLFLSGRCLTQTSLCLVDVLTPTRLCLVGVLTRLFLSRWMFWHGLVFVWQMFWLRLVELQENKYWIYSCVHFFLFGSRLGLPSAAPPDSSVTHV